ncbi:hypothetical protein UFOVP1365_25 [uncultured Caudovirales phage]|uniref:Uncharacterized protein n=1 Tax=uncultured Caudovirales phage TaxID=2100421 RepID=A0A6J5S2U4_9CAUD|nr:hypothetical protein UFOVP1365_25 [uncultured Caudovirales phage]
MAIVTIGNPNAATAKDKQHAMQQRNKYKQGSAQWNSWNSRIASIDNGTFDRSKIKAGASSISDATNSGAANDGINKFLVDPEYSTPKKVDEVSDPAFRQQMIDAAYKSLTKNTDADYNTERAQLQGELVNSGNPVGSPKYNNQMALLDRKYSDIKANAQNQSQMTGMDYLGQNIQQKVAVTGANNQTLDTIGGIQGGYAGQKIAQNEINQKKREADQMFRLKMRTGAGGASTQESPFATTPYPMGQ